MIQINMIGHLGKDCELHVHGIENVLNFNLAHTDKYKNSDGTVVQKTTWVRCSWWVERTTVAQYLKKGVQVYVSGFPEAKQWKDRNGEVHSYLNMRVYNLQLLGGKREDNQNQQANTAPIADNNQNGFQPIDDSNDLPF